VWFVLVGVLMFFERGMIFYPTRYPDGMWDTSAVSRATGMAVEDRFIEAADGNRLHGWWWRPAGVEHNTDTLPVLLFFHGNAGNLSHRVDLVAQLVRIPANVLIIDYRGYGRSQGRPSERGLYRDGEASWNHLVNDLAVDPARIVVFGKSLGGAVAVDVSLQFQPGGLILQSTFTSVPDVAARHFPFVPRFLIRTKMDSEEKLRSVTAPTLVIHGPSDEIIPFELGRRVYDAAAGPKRFHEVRGAGHNETWLVGGPAYREAIRSFVVECSGP